MTNQIKLSDAMWTTGESIVNFANKAGIETSIMKVYNKESAKKLAFITSLFISLIKEELGEDVEIINE